MCKPGLLDERLVIKSLEIPNRFYLIHKVNLHPTLGLYTVTVYCNGCMVTVNTVTVSVSSVN